MQYSSSDEAVFMSMSKPDLLEVVATQQFRPAKL